MLVKSGCSQELKYLPILIFVCLFVCFTKSSLTATNHLSSTEQQHFCQHINIFRAKLGSFSICVKLTVVLYTTGFTLFPLGSYAMTNLVVLGSLRTMNINGVFSFWVLQLHSVRRKKGRKGSYRW